MSESITTSADSPGSAGENLVLEYPGSGSRAVIYPFLGGTVGALELGEAGFTVLESDSREELLSNPLFRGRILFPFNDRIPGGRYTFGGTEYRLPLNCSEDGSAIHGFLYDKRMTVLSAGKTSASLFWRTGAGRYDGYPFDLSVAIDFSIGIDSFWISFTVKNEGDRPAPFALGWHSYFKAEDDSVLYADYPCYFGINSRFLPEGPCVPARGTAFDFSSGSGFLSMKLDHTFKAPAGGVTVIRRRNFSVEIVQENFAYTQLFVPPGRGSIAVEPISSKPDSFNSPDVLVLEPKEVYSSSVRISVRENLV